MNGLDKYFKLVNDLKNLKAQFKSEGVNNPEGKLKELGIDLSKIDINALLQSQTELLELSDKLKSVFPDEQYGDLSNLFKKLQEKDKLSVNDYAKLFNAFSGTILDDIVEQGKECFQINKNECSGEIIKSHSIQKKNNKLSRISKLNGSRSEVYYFENINFNREKRIKPISINEASTFKGFCSRHDDEIFKPIETAPFDGSPQHCFLHSYRSFAYSYHQKKQLHNYLIQKVKTNIEIAQRAFYILSGITTAIGMKTNVPVPTFANRGFSDEHLKELAAQRFEEHRTYLNNYLKDAKYEQLDFLIRKINHVCPVVSASLLVLHIEFSGGYLIPDHSKVYRGIPFMLTIFPENDSSTYIILARFKMDITSELVFNKLRQLNDQAFGIEMTKHIFEQLENFYIAPSYWDSISDQEKGIFSNDLNIQKNNFPEASDFIPKLNLFDSKYSIPSQP